MSRERLRCRLSWFTLVGKLLAVVAAMNESNFVSKGHITDIANGDMPFWLAII